MAEQIEAFRGDEVRTTVADVQLMVFSSVQVVRRVRSLVDIRKGGLSNGPPSG
jgi:hypothetical protein